MTKQDILNKLQKIKALADHGIDGEQSNAQKLLDAMMKKYNITEDDLMDDKEDMVFFKVHGYKCKNLFHQIARVVCNISKILYIGPENQTINAKKVRNMTKGLRPAGSNVVLFCTKAQFIELEYIYEILQRSFDKHVEGMFYAFLDKNNLLAPVDPNNPNSNMSDEEIELAYRMSLAVKKENINKALPETLISSV